MAKRPVSQDTCNVGDAVLAKYEGTGELYSARIVRVDGDVITVNWIDGDADHRHVDSINVFKDGVCCAPEPGQWIRYGKLILRAVIQIKHTIE